MESPRDQVDLAVELRALRPRPRSAFTAELDARAATGFEGTGRRPSSAIGRIPKLFSAAPRRRLLAPAGAIAVMAIAVATAVDIASEHGPATSTPPGPTPLASGPPPPKAAPSAAAGSAPVIRSKAPSAAGSPTIFPEAPPPPGPYASRARHRELERSAQLVLATDASEVRSASAKVLEIVQAYHGIVLRSSIQEGGKGEAGATFDLLIPSGRLAAAMAAFSEIADVSSRHETAEDVTGPMIGLGERLRDARAKVESLLAQLAAAQTEAEREIAEAKLRSARRHAAVLRAQLTALRRRTHLSSLSLQIESGGGSVSPSGGWGLDDALGDAGHILSVAAGVGLVGLAVLVLPALILLLLWLGRREWVRRRREHALD